MPEQFLWPHNMHSLVLGPTVIGLGPIWVEWCPHRCRDQEFHSRTVHCCKALQLFLSAVSGLCFTFGNDEMVKMLWVTKGKKEKWRDRNDQDPRNEMAPYFVVYHVLFFVCLPSPVIAVKRKNAIMYLYYQCRWSTPRWFNLRAASLQRNLLESRVLIDHRLCGELINPDLNQ